jgi:signal transduction histidine kinase
MATQLLGTGAPAVWGPRPGGSRDRRPGEEHATTEESISARLRADVSALAQARLLAAQETERRRIARDLHDVVGQALTAVKLSLESIGRTGGLGDGHAADSVAESISTVDTVIQMIRAFAMDLRPPVLDDLGLGPALRWHLKRSVKDTTIEARFISDVMDERYPTDVETACYRITQEAITNVLRHAHAASITVRLERCEALLHVQILDDGRGFDIVDADGARSSLGLLGMSDRAELVGGNLTVHSVSGQGTLVDARFPLGPGPVEGSR